MRQKSAEFTLDPVERAYRMQEREQFVTSLFHPIYEHEPPPLRWLVHDWIPRGYLVFLAAGPKKGKTCLASNIALAVATGTPFAGMHTEQAAVLWLAEEESPHERRLVLATHPLAQPSTPLYTCYQHVRIDDVDSLDAIGQGINILEAWQN